MRLNSDGSRDTSFTLNTYSLESQQITEMDVQSDGKFLFTVGGSNNLRRLLSTGTNDSTFVNYAYNNPVKTISLTTD